MKSRSMINGICVNRLLIKILILIFLITNSSLSYALRPLASNSPAVVEDIESDITAKQDAPPSYFIPDVTQDELKKILSSTVGPVVDASMEALIPELGKDALEA